MSNVAEVQQLELLSESLKNEIDELQSILENSDSFLLKAKRKSIQDHLESIISNLETTNNSIYNVFEELNCDSGEDLEEKCSIMEDMLREKLTYEEKTYLRLKHNIDLY